METFFSVVLNTLVIAKVGGSWVIQTNGLRSAMFFYDDEKQKKGIFKRGLVLFSK